MKRLLLTFRNVSSCITVVSPIDTTTLATHFINGLKGKVVKALATVTSLETMQNLDLVMIAAEEMEAKLNLADKQAHPILAALAEVLALAEVIYNPGRGNSNPGRGTTTPVEVTTTLQEVTMPQTIPETTTVHTEVLLPILALFLLGVQTATPLPAAMQMLLTKVQVVVVDCGSKHQGMTSGTAGQRGALVSSLTQLRQVSFSSDTYYHAYAVSTADAELPLHSSAVCASTDLVDFWQA